MRAKEVRTRLLSLGASVRLVEAGFKAYLAQEVGSGRVIFGRDGWLALADGAHVRIIIMQNAADLGKNNAIRGMTDEGLVSDTRVALAVMLSVGWYNRTQMF